MSCAMNDPSPFTLLAFMLAVARRRAHDWRDVSGTSNKSA
jgi:methylmalonyl-CoA mutase N-terminal domain/subunit